MPASVDNMSRWLTVALLGSILTSSLWIVFPIAGVFPLLILVGLFAVLAALPQGTAASTVPQTKINPWESSIVSAVIVAPSLLYLALSWFQEFPFRGDHDYHLMQSDSAFMMWRTFFIPVCALIIFSWWVSSRRHGRWLVLFVFIFFFAIGPGIEGKFLYAIRYPGIFYFLATPQKLLAMSGSWMTPLDALRLTNFLSIPVWLWVLRPLALKRWPDWSLLPFGIFFFAQQHVVYYFTSAYLEPWAIVLTLLAAEYLLRFRLIEPWKVMALLGIGAMVKEQVILIVPFFFLAAYPWKEDHKDRQRFLIATITSCFPFVLYYLVRSASSVWRTAGLAQSSEIFSFARIALLFDRLFQQLSFYSFLIVAVTVALLVVAARRRETRTALLAIFAAATMQAAFFYVDRISVPWTGYLRFELLAIALLGTSLIWIGQSFINSERYLPLAVLCAGLTIAMAPSLIRFESAASGPDYRRNFFENRDAAIFLPVHQLTSAAESKGMLAPVRRIRFVSNISEAIKDGQIRALPAGYPEIASRFRIGIADVAAEGACRCRNDAEAVAGLFVDFVNLGASEPARGPSIQSANRCLDVLKSTCEKTIEVRDGDELIGALGAGFKRLTPLSSVASTPATAVSEIAPP